MPFQLRFEPPEEQVAESIKKLNGNIAAVCKELGTTRGTFQHYCERHPAIATVLYESREEMLDMAESSLYRRVLAGESWAVCFFLKTQGRKRGYIERAETFRLNVDLNELTLEQLERLASGEHPSLVLGTSGTESRQGAAGTDPDTIEGTSRPGAEEEA
jgi:hypothetical protein